MLVVFGVLCGCVLPLVVVPCGLLIVVWFVLFVGVALLFVDGRLIGVVCCVFCPLLFCV